MLKSLFALFTGHLGPAHDGFVFIYRAPIEMI